MTKQKRACVKNKIQKSLPKIDPLPGAVCAQSKRCGKPNCKCARGRLHGQYYYRFFYAGGVLRKQYVRKADVEAVKRACLMYRRERQKARLLLEQSKNEWRTLKWMLKELGL